MPQIYNGKTCYTFEETREMIDAQIEKDAIYVARTICERRLKPTNRACIK